jgi:hypothetical protein
MWEKIKGKLCNVDAVYTLPEIGRGMEGSGVRPLGSGIHVSRSLIYFTARTEGVYPGQPHIVSQTGFMNDSGLDKQHLASRY